MCARAGEGGVASSDGGVFRPWLDDRQGVRDPPLVPPCPLFPSLLPFPTDDHSMSEKQWKRWKSLGLRLMFSSSRV